MRKVLLACTAALALSGCAQLQTIFGGITSATPTQLVVDVEQAAVAACNFLPTAETVAGIIAVGNPALATATAIANAICAAVSPKTQIAQSLLSSPAMRSVVKPNATVPTVAGVPVHGTFVH